MQKLAPYPHQMEDIWRAISEPTQGILIASEQDQGKTLMTCEILLALNLKRVLLVGIKDTFAQWDGRTLAQSDGQQGVLNIDTTKQGQLNLEAYRSGADGWYFIGHSLLTRRDYEQYQARSKDGEMVNKSRRIGFWESMPKPDAVVVDEIHLVANYNSKGRETLHSIKAGWKIALSGTFYGNKFANAWAPTAWLWPDRAEPYHFWYGKWCDEKPVLKKNGQPLLTPKGRALKVLIGEKAPEGTFVSTLPCYIRRVGKDPMPDPKVITVELNNEQRRIYTEMETQQLAYLKSHPWLTEVPIAARSALKTITLATPSIDPVTEEISFDEDATSSKVDALLKELALHPGERVVIATDRKRFAKLVVAKMRAEGLNAVEWSGDVNSAGREEIKRQWLSGEVDYIVCVMKSFSTGLDWAQHNCWRIGVLSSPEGDPTTKQQFLRRVFRTGEHKDKFEWFEILAENTYDTGIFENVELQALAQQRSLA